MIKILQKEWRNILTVSPYKNLIKSKNLMLSKQIGWMKFEIKRNKGWSKKKSKENVIRAQNEIRGIPVAKNSLFAGPSTYLPYLEDNKVAYFNLRLRGFGDAPVTIDVKLSVQDSENSAGVVIDAIRYLQVAKEMGIVGALRGPSAWTQKTPPKQMMYADAKAACAAFAKRELSEALKSQHSTK
jgi:myo-inositol-1-phosphate synthase